MTIKNLDDPRLKERDRILINLLADGMTDFTKWKEQSYKEMTKSEYFTETKDGRPRLVKVTNFLAKVCLIIFIIFFAYTITGHSNELLEFLDYFTEIEERDLSNLKISTTQLYIFSVFIILSGVILATFITGLIVARFDYNNTKKKSNLRRTEKGNRIAEYIFGLKNFISDFTMLSEREKKELVLRDDFLIYAIVLEENNKIVDEIFSYRDEENLEKVFHKIKNYI